MFKKQLVIKTGEHYTSLGRYWRVPKMLVEKTTKKVWIISVVKKQKHYIVIERKQLADV